MTVGKRVNVKRIREPSRVGDGTVTGVPVNDRISLDRIYKIHMIHKIIL